MFPGGKTEELPHEEVRELYNPLLERKDPSVINEEINTLADLDVRNPIEKLDDLAGKSFLMDPRDDGTRQRATIMQLVEGVKRFSHELEKDPKRIKSLVKYKINEEQKEELMTYAKILDYIERNADENQQGIYWKF